LRDFFYRPDALPVTQPASHLSKRQSVKALKEYSHRQHLMARVSSISTQLSRLKYSFNVVSPMLGSNVRISLFLVLPVHVSQM